MIASPSPSGVVSRRLAFFKGLQLLTNRIHASKDVSGWSSSSTR